MTKKTRTKSKPSSEALTAVDTLSKHIRRHFSDLDYHIGGFLYRCLFLVDDPNFNAVISPRTPNNDVLYQKAWPAIFTDGREETAIMYDRLVLLFGRDLISQSMIGTTRMLIHMRSGDIMKALI